MNVNRVYIADIYIYHGRKYDNRKVTFGSFVKPAVVYHTDDGEYVDLYTKEKYKFSNVDIKYGDLYIYFKNGLIPIQTRLDEKFNKLNVSKRKIKKKLLNTAVSLSKGEKDK